MQANRMGFKKEKKYITSVGLCGAVDAKFLMNPG